MESETTAGRVPSNRSLHKVTNILTSALQTSFNSLMFFGCILASTWARRVHRLGGLKLKEKGVLPHYSICIYTTAFKELFDTEAGMINLEFGVVEGKICQRKSGYLGRED